MRIKENLKIFKNLIALILSIYFDRSNMLAHETTNWIRSLYETCWRRLAMKLCRYTYMGTQ